MSLLLLLSALLTALSGTGTRAPAPQAAVAVAQIVGAQVEPGSEVAAAAARPVMQPLSAPRVVPVAALDFVERRWASLGERRRE